MNVCEWAESAAVISGAVAVGIIVGMLAARAWRKSEVRITVGDPLAKVAPPLDGKRLGRIALSNQRAPRDEP